LKKGHAEEMSHTSENSRVIISHTSKNSRVIIGEDHACRGWNKKYKMQSQFFWLRIKKYI